MADSVNSYAVLTSVSAVMAGGATVIWALRSARSTAPVRAGRAPRVQAGPVELGGLVGLVVAAGALLTIGDPGPVRSIEQMAALALLVATTLRVYRFNRAGPVALDRFGAALALVPATALLVGGALVFMIAARPLAEYALQWWGGYLLAGVVSLAVGLRWRHLASTTQSEVSATH